MSAVEQSGLFPKAETSPLASTASRMTALDPYRTYEVRVPETGGWVPVSWLADAAVLSSWHEALLVQLGDRRAAAVSLGRAVASAFVLTWAFPVLVESRLPLGSTTDAAVHRHPQGWVDGVAFGSERAAVLPGDPAAGASGVELVPDRGALLEALAAKLAEVEPFFDAVRGVCRLGWPVLWGELADQLGTGALWLARLMKRDRWAAWREAEAVVDHLASHAPRARLRPRPFAVTWSGGEELFAVRGTCCLNYRLVEESAPASKRYCSVCPLRSDEWRIPVLRAHLEGKPPE